MADLIAELLLMNLKREVSAVNGEAGGEASFAPQMYRPYARLAAHYAYDDAQEGLEQEFLESLRNKKRSPEVAQALSQFKNERMVLMGGNPGNKILRPPADWGKMLMKRQNQLIFNPV
ncbi:uncharacterized protein LOC111701233 [Eurytemora carolleeae]|uniref:uncharacterized protein LOC111701233 n=1 Tax=Eurytemora carolleeae TaxID=1294199 RepID=UPI000C7567FD|nr:uncharacterized protein LOC111701233 [Eurytemora carolleeae]|eukprot:XP_023328189.1 uncharacterized protein LOC111701233 [Eurytemora affinis]